MITGSITNRDTVMGKIILVGCVKGGAGKTTTSTNLAVALARKDASVVLADCDHQENSTRWVEARNETDLQPQIDYAQTKGKQAAQLMKLLATKYDYVVVDVHGGNTVEMQSIMTVADIQIAPHQASGYDLMTLAELRDQYESSKIVNPEMPLLVYQERCDFSDKGKVKDREEFLEALKEFPEFTVTKAYGVFRKSYKKAIDTGASVFDLPANDSGASKAQAEIDALADEVLSYVG